MLKYISILLLFFTSLVQAADVSVRLDRHQVQYGETVNLIISADAQLDISPDLSVLQKNFRLLGNAINTSVQVINGRTHSRTEWAITMLPRQEGKLIIPSLTVGKEKTKPLELTVIKSAQQVTPGDLPDAFLEVSINPKQAYVQQQLIYSLKLYSTKPIANGHLEPPHSAQLKLVQAEDDHRYIGVKGGKQYQIFERNYLVFPQKDGSISIEPPYFSGMLLNSSSPLTTLSSDYAKSLHLQGKPVSINVKPKPANYTGKWWLPAESVTLSEQWSANIKSWQAGEPITRTIRLQAIGLSADQLPQLNFSSDDKLKIYPDKPVKNTTVVDGKVVGTLEMKVALVPTQAGPLNIPPITISWWNVASDQRKAATLAAHHLTIRAAPQVQQTKAPTPPVKAARTIPDIGKSWFWPIVVGVLLLMWLFTLAAWLRLRRVRVSVHAKKEKQSANPKDSLKVLKQACLNNDASATMNALTRWASDYWPDGRLIGVNEIAKRLGSDALAEAIAGLEASLYAQEASDWDGKAFWKTFKKAKKVKVNDSSKPDESLPPLYLNN